MTILRKELPAASCLLVKGAIPAIRSTGLPLQRVPVFLRGRMDIDIFESSRPAPVQTLRLAHLPVVLRKVLSEPLNGFLGMFGLVTKHA